MECSSQSSVLSTELKINLKKAQGFIGRNVVNISTDMRTLVRLPKLIKVMKLHRKKIVHKKEDSLAYEVSSSESNKVNFENAVLISIYDTVS